GWGVCARETPAPPAGGGLSQSPPPITARSTGRAGLRTSALYAPALLGPAPIVGNRRDVLDTGDLQAGRRERADGRLAAGARALYEHVHLLQPVFLGLPRCGLRRELGGERGGLPGALEPDVARAGPREGVALKVGDGDDGVVERRLDVRLAVDDVLLLLPPGLLGLGLRHTYPFFPAAGFFLPGTVFFGPLRVRAFVCVRCPCTGRLRRGRMPWWRPVSIFSF